jgi:hypothetical protein
MPDTTDLTERWLPIPGWEGRYEASGLGRIRSLARVVRTAGGWSQSYRARVMRPNVRLDGRLRVTLCRDGRNHYFLVHRLVLLAFVGPCPPGMEGCHNDGNPANNHAGNLRWDTHGENMLDCERHGTNHWRNQIQCPWGHPLAAPNLVRSSWAVGRRSCLACARTRPAKQRARERGSVVFDFQAISDAHFARIMSA